MQTQNAKEKPKTKKATKPKASKEKKEYVYALEPLPEKTVNKAPWESEHEVGMLLAALIKTSGFNSVLDLGTYTGKTTDAMLQALPENGSIISVDIEDHRGEVFKEICGFDTRIKYVLGDSIETCKNLYGQKFDLIFVDTVHEWSYALPEFKAIELLINKGGILAYHDSIKFEGIERLMNYAKVFGYNAVTINTPAANGLTLLQK
jgi:predicted O-methyltransferase YrrM